MNKRGFMALVYAIFSLKTEAKYHTPHPAESSRGLIFSHMTKIYVEQYTPRKEDISNISKHNISRDP
jgi:hypothetical protein